MEELEHSFKARTKPRTEPHPLKKNVLSIRVSQQKKTRTETQRGA